MKYPLYSQISQEIRKFKWVRSESHFQGEQVDPRSAQADSTIETLAGRVYALAGISERAYRSYRGGSAIQTVSLRGMSPEHTLVLIDGQQYNDFQTGLADFGLPSTTNLERVEVTTGGYSAVVKWRMSPVVDTATNLSFARFRGDCGHRGYRYFG